MAFPKIAEKVLTSAGMTIKGDFAKMDLCKERYSLCVKCYSSENKKYDYTLIDNKELVILDDSSVYAIKYFYYLLGFLEAFISDYEDSVDNHELSQAMEEFMEKACKELEEME